MKIVGRRSDGALYLSVGGGLACILKADRVSPVVDQNVVEKLGPWHGHESDKTFDARRSAQARMDLARYAGMDFFVLSGMSFDEKRDRVMNALRSKLGLPSIGAYAPYPMDFYVPQNGMGEDWVVYCIQGKHYGMTYAIDEAGTVSFEDAPVEVHQTWESLDEDSEFAADLKQSPWFKKFMANKKKNMTEMPGSLPNLSKKSMTDLPGSLPEIGTSTKNMPGSLPNS